MDDSPSDKEVFYSPNDQFSENKSGIFNNLGNS